MGDIRGFLKIKRAEEKKRPVKKRIKDFKEIPLLRPKKVFREQGARCMDCGIPFCHWGCPVSNVIPEWNDLLYRGRIEDAVSLLRASNNFPEITGRVCPALCEYACVLGINDDPVTIRENELEVIEYAFQKGIIRPMPPRKRTGRKIAVVGSGPSGLACADLLNRAGHNVTIFEKAPRIGGILRYGIPDFKLEKHIIDRRIDILEREGIVFKVNRFVEKPGKRFDAVCLAIGAGEPRDIGVQGRSLKGIYFAMDFLSQSNRKVNGEYTAAEGDITACGKNVVVIGGGDTGSDCVGTARRQGAASITQIEIMPKPPVLRTEDMPWPAYPRILKTSTSHEEGCTRKWSVRTKRFAGKYGRVAEVVCETGGREFELKADLVLLAMGFLHPVHKGLLDGLKIKYTPRGNIMAQRGYMTSQKGIFCAGDCRTGASLVVRAIAEGRACAEAVINYLSRLSGK